MINYTENYFDLELIKLSDIRLHEATENNRLRNIYNRISKSKYLINPVIVGKQNEELILLDGANRYGSLKEIGCKLILAQVLDYKDKELILEKWNHLVYDFDIKLLIDFCDSNSISYKKTSYNEGLKVLENNFNFLLAADIVSDESILLKLSPKLGELLDQIDKITKLYFKQNPFDRSECDIKYSDLRKYTRRKGVLFVFPTFQKQHIVMIANNNHRLPAGISRHRIQNRVLHVKYEIKKLMSDKNLSEKQEELKKLLIDKIDKNKVRQYQESVIVFDE
ncbi:MAG TPA: hypothetical protein PKC91_00205 [Ignavibacteria bacterium]|nr:hypothetical protein [Ignavibacteria bacterium]